MTIKRFYKKGIYLIVVPSVKVINYFSPAYAMRIYSRLLHFVGVKIKGKPRFISMDVKIDTFDLIEIGERSVISERVVLLTHDYSHTTALVAINETPKCDLSINRKITIGNNVFIGLGTIVLPGTTIGDNVIIGAGSVVRGFVQSDSLYIGNPGEIIGNIQHHAEKCKAIVSSQNVLIAKGQKNK